jgi:hypothetical protein
MLHDLRCTEENPATYENMLFRQSQQIADDSLNDNHPNSYERFSSRTSIKNDDGTMIDIVKEKNMRGKEELIEIKYDPQGNIISRKKAGNFVSSAPQNSFHELNEYNDYDYENDYETKYDNNNNTYYEMNNEVEVRQTPSVIYETAEAQEIVYEAPAKYDPHITVNKPIFEQTIINAHEGISDGTLNNIIRNTLNTSNNDYNIQNDINLNGFDYSQNNYSQSNEIDTNTYSNQNFNDNNYNIENNDLFNNDNQIDNNSFNENNFNVNELVSNSTGNDNLNYNSYDYQY